eukprot:TRINITY_DN3298_c0_g1_i1.p1 TRINITY_DN3298_c0_g1~~TRINITY_DN3298_c0_g1_i1.p1  ORF type:complete len:174 (-),score=50.24 TRINITY_DN3298_c0_g1_i1:71-532(-)
MNKPLIFSVVLLISFICVILAFALSASSREKRLLECDENFYFFFISERTIALVIITSVFSLLLCFFSFYVIKFNPNRLNSQINLILHWTLCAFWLISWAVMAKDIANLRDVEGCSVPHVWGAAFTFSFFSWLSYVVGGILLILIFREQHVQNN